MCVYHHLASGFFKFGSQLLFRAIFIIWKQRCFTQICQIWRFFTQRLPIAFTFLPMFVHALEKLFKTLECSFGDVECSFGEPAENFLPKGRKHFSQIKKLCFFHEFFPFLKLFLWIIAKMP